MNSQVTAGAHERVFPVAIVVNEWLEINKP